MRRAEEPLTMLQRINSILVRRCETVASDLKDSMNGVCPPTPYSYEVALSRNPILCESGTAVIYLRCLCLPGDEHLNTSTVIMLTAPELPFVGRFGPLLSCEPLSMMRVITIPELQSYTLISHPGRAACALVLWQSTQQLPQTLQAERAGVPLNHCLKGAMSIFKYKNC